MQVQLWITSQWWEMKNSIYIYIYILTSSSLLHLISSFFSSHLLCSLLLRSFSFSFSLLFVIPICSLCSFTNVDRHSASNSCDRFWCGAQRVYTDNPTRISVSFIEIKQEVSDQDERDLTSFTVGPLSSIIIRKWILSILRADIIKLM